jgi:hypothetical protein
LLCHLHLTAFNETDNIEFITKVKTFLYFFKQKK